MTTKHELTAQIVLRIRPETRERLLTLAAAEERSLANTARLLIERGLKLVERHMQ
jgi:hypothetical protein